MRRALEDFSQVIKRWLPAGVWMGIILYASTDVGSLGNSTHMVNPFLLWLFPNISEADAYKVNIFVRKTAHVTEFVILALLVWHSYGCLKTRPRWRDLRLAVIVLAIAAGFGVGSEVIQLFTNTRAASVYDALLDFSGSLLGLVIIFLWKWIHYRQVVPKEGIRILITADLHLNIEKIDGLPVLDQIRRAIKQTQADVCVVAGDIGTADQAARWVSSLKEATAGTKIVLCLGNHDHWIDWMSWPDYGSPQAVREKIWQPVVSAAGVKCLDFENVELDKIVITGGYGHYDLGMRDPSLSADGKKAGIEDYLAGTFGGVTWNDMSNIPNASDILYQEAQQQADSILARLDLAVATGKPVLLITHTLPFPELNAHLHQPPTPLHFFNAYAGNTALSKRLPAYASQICLAVCGHTHAVVPLGKIHGIPCLNIGSDYGKLRFAVFETASGKIEFPL